MFLFGISYVCVVEFFDHFTSISVLRGLKDLTGLKLKIKGGVPTPIFGQGGGTFGTVITVILTKKPRFTIGFFGYKLNLDVLPYVWTVPNVYYYR